jgi:monomeric sarcosine oxidase
MSGKAVPPSAGHYQVVVIGGGIVGVSAAWALALGSAERKKAKVLLLETWQPGHTRGSSHGDGRIVRFTYPEEVYIEMARRVFPLWREIAKEAPEPIFFQTGSWECGRGGSPQLAELEQALERAGIAWRRYNASESRRRFPQFELPLGSEVIYQPEGAVVRAGAAVETLWQAAERAGAELHAGEKVVEILPGEPATIVTERASYTADSVVLAAGAWSGQLLRSLGLDLPLEPSREVVAYFAVASRSSTGAVDHRAGSMPTLIDYHTDPPFYALPQVEVPGVKVGWHHTGPCTDPDQEGVADEGVLRKIQGWVVDRMPFLDIRPLQVETCLYTNTPDYHFVLDRHPEIPNLAIGAGFSGHGFKFGPVLGEILADLATGHQPAFDLELFGAGRFRPDARLEKRTSA